MLTSFPPRLILDAINRRSVVYRSLISNPGCDYVRDKERVYVRNLEVPSGGVVGTARGIARAYGVLRPAGASWASPGNAGPPGRAGGAAVVGDLRRRLLPRPRPVLAGLLQAGRRLQFGGPRSFGAPGSGGALGFADPDAGLGYAYVTSQMGTNLTGDPRDIALRDALYAALERSEAEPAAR